MEFILNDANLDLDWSGSSEKSENQAPKTESFHSESAEEINDYFNLKFRQAEINAEKITRKPESKIKHFKTFDVPPSQQAKTLLKSRIVHDAPDNREYPVKEIKRIAGTEEKSFIILSHDIGEDPLAAELETKIKEYKKETERILSENKEKFSREKKEKLEERRKTFQEILSSSKCFDHIQEKVGENELEGFEGLILELSDSLKVIEHELNKKSKEIETLAVKSKLDKGLVIEARSKYLDSVNSKVVFEKRVQKIMSLSLSKTEKKLKEYYKSYLDLLELSKSFSKYHGNFFISELKNSIQDSQHLINKTIHKKKLIISELNLARLNRDKKIKEILLELEDKFQLFEEFQKSCEAEKIEVSKLRQNFADLEESTKEKRAEFDRFEFRIRMNELELENLEQGRREIKKDIKELESQIREMKIMAEVFSFQIPYKVQLISDSKQMLEEERFKVEKWIVQVDRELEQAKSFRCLNEGMVRRTSGVFFSCFQETCEVLDSEILTGALSVRDGEV